MLELTPRPVEEVLRGTLNGQPLLIEFGVAERTEVERGLSSSIAVAGSADPALCEHLENEELPTGVGFLTTVWDTVPIAEGAFPIAPGADGETPRPPRGARIWLQAFDGSGSETVSKMSVSGVITVREVTVDSILLEYDVVLEGGDNLSGLLRHSACDYSLPFDPPPM
jgi:hypothetical protein